MISIVLMLFSAFAVAAGLREVWIQRTMRRHGLDMVGVVLRHTAYPGRNTDSPGVTYAPVIRYEDEYGQAHEFESTVRTSIRRPPVGKSVRVVQLPGRPESARLDTLGRKALRLFLTFGLAISFLAVALIIRP